MNKIRDPFYLRLVDIYCLEFEKSIREYEKIELSIMLENIDKNFDSFLVGFFMKICACKYLGADLHHRPKQIATRLGISYT